MPAEASSKNIINNFTDKNTEVWVKKPSSNSSREIRDTILKENFGYTDADIVALDMAKPGYFYVSDSRDTKNWATFEHVGSWKINANGEVPISMTQNMITNLTLFREQRANLEIFKVAMFISDPQIRDLFRNDLDAILNNFGQKRIDAFNNLMVTIEGAGNNRSQFYQAFRFLTNESGYKDNPFLLLAFARTTIYQSSTPSMGSTQVNQSQIANAVTSANNNLYNSSMKNRLGKIDKSEAMAINNWASDAYRKSNAEQESKNRDWIVRFMGMSEEEKNSYNDGDLIPILPPNTRVVRTPTNNETRLNNLNKKFDETTKQWREIDNIGQPQPVKTDHRTSELFQREDDTFEKEGWQKNKNRGTNQDYQPKVKPVLVPNNFNPYKEANVLVDGYGAVFTLYLEAAKWNNFDRRMRVITNYLNKKEELERKIINERYRLKPPRPEVTLQHIKEFARYGRVTVNTFEKREISYNLNRLFELLEEGRAYYK